MSGKIRGSVRTAPRPGRCSPSSAVTLVVLILAALAAVFIITKGPSPAARAEFVRRTADSGIGFVTKLFVPADEIEAILAGDEAEQTPAGDEDAAPLGVRDSGRERRARYLRSPGRERRARDLRGPGRRAQSRRRMPARLQARGNKT